MKAEKKKTDYNKWIFRLMVGLVTIGTIISILILPAEKDSTFYVDGETEEPAEEAPSLSGDFYWVKQDGTRELIELPTKLDVACGETMVIEGILPDDFCQSAIIVRASQQNMRIYIDGELRVDYDTKDTRPVGSQTTSRFVVCRMSEADAGKLLRIETISNARGYSGIANTIYACDRFEFWRFVYQKYGSDALSGAIIMLFGLFTICISIALTIGFKNNFDLEFVGWGIFLAGCWLLCESKVRQLLLANTTILSNLCFLAIMLGTYPLLIYIDGIQNHRYKKLNHGFCGIVLANFVIQNILQVANVADYLDMLPVSHFVLILTILFAVVTFILDYRRGLISEYREICIGMLILMGSVLIEVISMYFVTMIVGYTLTVGVCIFVGVGILKTIRDVQRNEKKRQEERLKEQLKQSEIMSMQMIQTLSDTLEAKDEYTRGHSHRVAEYSAILARAVGMDEKKISKLHYAASLHDIGKIGIPDTVLNKPGRLTDEEYEIIKTHTVIGADILKKVELIAYSEQVARYHHERYDGKGYPEGLSGEDIPLEARIVALADSYDAMSSKRVYRKPLEEAAIREEIVKGLGTQFDPILGEEFLRLLEEGAFCDMGESALLAGKPDYSRQYVGSEEANKIVSMLIDTMQTKADGDDLDFLTGIPRRGRGEKLCRERLRLAGGTVVFFDMDNLKPINDLYGHKAGDRALKLTAQVLLTVGGDSIVYRQGGDEFLLFLDSDKEEEVTAIVDSLMKQFFERKSKDIQIERASLSAGICICRPGDDFMEAVSKADKALYYIKHRGKAGYHVYNEDKGEANSDKTRADMDKLMHAISAAGKYEGAMELEYRDFAKMYEFIGNLCERYQHTCQLILVTLDVKSGESIYIEELERALRDMEISIRENIRNVDICTRYSSMQILLILLEAEETSISTIMERIFSRFHKICSSTVFEPTYEVRSMVGE